MNHSKDHSKITSSPTSTNWSPGEAWSGRLACASGDTSSGCISRLIFCTAPSSRRSRFLACLLSRVRNVHLCMASQLPVMCTQVLGAQLPGGVTLLRPVPCAPSASTRTRNPNAPPATAASRWCSAILSSTSVRQQGRGKCQRLLRREHPPR